MNGFWKILILMLVGTFAGILGVTANALADPSLPVSELSATFAGIAEVFMILLIFGVAVVIRESVAEKWTWAAYGWASVAYTLAYFDGGASSPEVAPAELWLLFGLLTGIMAITAIPSVSTKLESVFGETEVAD